MRRFAMIVTAGWMLIRLPVGSDPILPVQFWVVVASFDTAKECERVRMRAAEEGNREQIIRTSRCVHTEMMDQRAY